MKPYAIGVSRTRKSDSPPVWASPRAASFATPPLTVLRCITRAPRLPEPRRRHNLTAGRRECQARGGLLALPVVLHDPVEHPAARVLAADALGPLEQAQPAAARSRWILREQRGPAEGDRRRWERRLNTVARDDPSPLVVELEEPLHRRLAGGAASTPWSSGAPRRTRSQRPGPARCCPASWPSRPFRRTRPVSRNRFP